MIYYTSDLHFGHDHIRLYENRPFMNLAEMEYELINKWNEKVKENDDVYILGDFAFTGKEMSVDDINDVVKSLNGKKHLIIGNHDEGWINKTDVKTRLWEEIVFYKRIVDSGNIVILSHYPLESWDRQRFGSIHIHGHLHSQPPKLNQPNRYNCGCDIWNYEPVTLKEMIDAHKRGDIMV